MDGAPMTAGSSSGSTSTGGPAPFLLKTYEMVDDSATDDIVSWSASRKSFVVWNPPEFARILLPTYFKHNNFSSFIRQLNTYGFRKIDPEKWEFSNEEFIKDKKHLLKNIHRRKPIHSHSNNPQISTVDPERANYEEEIEKLSREKSSLETQLTQLKQKSSMKLDLNELTHRVNSIETRQENLLTYLEKAVQNPNFVERLNQKLESMDFSAFNKKRRLPDNNQSGSHLNNLSLDLSSNINSGPREISLELSDMDDSSFSCKTQTNDEEECDVNILCELNLSLASSPLQIKGSGPGPEPTKPVPGPVQPRVNDVFWEQFLTERPGSDTEEASSCLRERNYVDNEEGSVGPTNNQLTL